jgi:P27 family predicted phage terminase small subunit
MSQILRAPKFLDDFAKEEWRRIVPLLKERNLLDELDIGALAGYCISYSIFRKMVEKLGSFDDFVVEIKYKTGAKYFQKRLELGILNDAMNNIVKFCKLFGLSPDSRGRMSIPENPDDEDDDDKRILD